jgi:hypothetical protein
MEWQRGDPLFRMCQASDCDQGQIHKAGVSRPIMKCNTCYLKTCFIHKRLWHTGMNCDEYDYTKQEDHATKGLESKHVKTVRGEENMTGIDSEDYFGSPGGYG